MPYVRDRTARRPAPPPPPGPHRAARGRGAQPRARRGARARPLLHGSQLSERCSGNGVEPRTDGGDFGPALGCGSPVTPPHTHTTARCQRVLWSRPWRRRVPEPGPAHHPLPTERCATRSGTKRALHAASPPRRAAAVRQQKPHSRTPSASGPAAGRGEGVGGHAGMNGTSGLGEPGASGRAERGPSTWPWRRRLTQPGRAERCGHPSAHPPIIHPSSIPPPAPPLPQPRGAAPSPQRPLSGASAPCPERNTPA